MTVQIGDVLIGQCSKHNKKIEDCSLSVMRGDEGVVHYVEKKRKNGFLFVKIIIASDLPVNIGDKFASRFSQKGVVGQIKNVWELPYMADGTVPDIIINPLSLPSRMTIPTILETLCGLITLQTGHHFVVSAFDQLSIKDLKQQVANVGFNANGTHQLRNAETGNLMTPIFMGPMYYNRLAHLSEDKCYGRETGRMSKLTRQPTDGRSRMGGLRVGEMERDAILALNMGNVLQERFFTSSDKFWIHVCKNCNNMSINDKLCFCGATSQSIKKVKCCFTNNLVFSQLKSLLCLVQFDKKPDQLQIVDDDMDEDEEI
jgi:DNA-directed RNA polymerase beta subunit